MRLLIQRVNHASVKVDGEVIGNIGKGFLVLVGIGQNDTREIADKYMKKMLGLRIFEDENRNVSHKMRQKIFTFLNIGSNFK